MQDCLSFTKISAGRAEETVVKEALTEEMIAAGAELTRSLDHAHWPLVAALWLFDPENNQWRLLLASSCVNEQGPRESYEHVSEALRALHEPVPLESVRVVSSEDPFVRAFRSAFRAGRRSEGRRVFRSAIDGHFVDDAYIYKVTPAA